MKIIFSLTILLILKISLYSQLVLPKKIVQPQTLQQVVKGLAENFSSIKGEENGTSPGTKEFTSKICWTGAEKCIIAEYSTAKGEKKSTVGNNSWQAIMPATENFKDAAKKFKQIYNQINNSTVSFGGKNIKLNAKYENPTEEIGFSSILFENKDKKRLQVQLELGNEGMEWQVKISVFEIEKEVE
jgi:hypothetical protein